MSHDTFISYATEDKAVADAMCHHLEQRGLRCWIAPRDVRPGEDYAAEIVDAISASRALVLVFSANANASKHVKNEVERAVSHGIPVIPFRTQDVQPAKSLELFLGARHWLDAMTRPMEAHFEKLAQHLKVLSGREIVDGLSAVPAGRPSDSATLSPGGGSLGRALRTLLRSALVAVPLVALGAALVWFVLLRRHEPARCAKQTHRPAPAAPEKASRRAPAVPRRRRRPAGRRRKRSTTPWG